MWERRFFQFYRVVWDDIRDYVEALMYFFLTLMVGLMDAFVGYIRLNKLKMIQSYSQNISHALFA